MSDDPIYDVPLVVSLAVEHLEHLHGIMPSGEMRDRLSTILSNFRVALDPDTPEHIRTRICEQDRW